MTLVTIDTTSINSSKSPATFHFYFNLETTQISGSTCNLYRLRIFNKLEVSRLDSRLSLFIIISSYIPTLSWCQRLVGFSRNGENLTTIRTHQLIKSDTLSRCQIVVRIQITFNTIRTPTTEEFEQRKLKVKRIILQQLNFTAQQVELITGTKEFRMLGNLRNFYCLQDHTTSNNNGKRQGQGQRTSQWGDPSFFQDHHQSPGCLLRCLLRHPRPQLRQQSMGCHPSQDNPQSSGKGDGKGSCALPGYSQWERCSHPSN